MSDVVGSTAPWKEIVSGISRRGMEDFWEAYEQCYDAALALMMDRVRKQPHLSKVLASMPDEDLERERDRGRALMRGALLENLWEPLLEQQRAQGALYATIGVPFHEWFELISAFQNVVLPSLISRCGNDAARLADALFAMSAYIDQCMSGIGDAYIATKERIIEQQQHAIKELSTPVLQLRPRLLLLPLVGILDTHRARLMTEQLLLAIRTHRAKVVVIDVTGVPAVDSKVANHLLQTLASARLMGARCVVTGFSAHVAEALVVLGVDVEALNTVGDLQGGIEEAERLLDQSLLRAVEEERASAAAAGR
jgi:anti-anti-sigma regulatory factor